MKLCYFHQVKNEKTEAQRGREQLKVAQLVSEDRDLKQAAWPQNSSVTPSVCPPRLGWKGAWSLHPQLGMGPRDRG